jgi:hypothetical protein
VDLQQREALRAARDRVTRLELTVEELAERVAELENTVPVRHFNLLDTARARRQLVLQLRDRGLSERAIASAAGVPRSTIVRDLHALGRGGPLDGSRGSPTR